MLPLKLGLQCCTQSLMASNTPISETMHYAQVQLSSSPPARKASAFLGKHEDMNVMRTSARIFSSFLRSSLFIYWSALNGQHLYHSKIWWELHAFMGFLLFATKS
jgi:hypothetical protein